MKHLLTLLTALLLTPLVAISFARPAQAANPAAEASDRLLAQVEPQIKAIYETNEFAVRSFGATWLPDGSGCLRLETAAGAKVPEIARYDAADGKRTVVVPSERLVVASGREVALTKDGNPGTIGNSHKARLGGRIPVVNPAIYGSEKSLSKKTCPTEEYERHT